MAAPRLPDRIVGPDGLLLRAWRPDDAPALARAVAESLEHLRPWMPWAAGEPPSLARRREMIWAWERDRRAGGDAVLGILLNDRIAGGCGLHRRIGPDGLEIGYWVHVDLLRRGIATAAAGLLTGAAFEIPCVTHVEIHHDQANQASAGVPAKLGYRLAAEVARQPQAPAESGIAWHWRMTRDQWAASRDRSGQRGGASAA